MIEYKCDVCGKKVSTFSAEGGQRFGPTEIELEKTHQSFRPTITFSSWGERPTLFCESCSSIILKTLADAIYKLIK